MEPEQTLTVSACPVCGELDTLADSVLQKLKDTGKANQDTHAYLYMHNSAISDPRKVNLSVPVILSYYDVCVNCGTVYCVHADVHQAVPQIPGIGSN